jgi:hypothetical protein
MVFIVFSSTLFHLPPLRFHCVVSDDAGIVSMTFVTLALAVRRSKLSDRSHSLQYRFSQFFLSILFYKFSFYINIYLVRCEGSDGVPEVLHQGSAGTAGAEGLQKCPAPETSKTERGREGLQKCPAPETSKTERGTEGLQKCPPPERSKTERGTESLQKCPAPERSKTERGR